MSFAQLLGEQQLATTLGENCKQMKLCTGTKES